MPRPLAIVLALMIVAGGSGGSGGATELKIIVTTALPTPTISIADASVVEGHTGSTSAVFTLTLSAQIGMPVTVAWATSGGTATPGVDFSPSSGVATFAALSTVTTVSVPIVGDAGNELDEAFLVSLSSPTVATIGDGTAVGTILDDDNIPVLSLTVASAREGASAQVVVRMSAPSGQTVTVDLATSDMTAQSPADYAPTSTTLTVAPGQTTVTHPVALTADALVEGDEDFICALGNPSAATLGVASAVALIMDAQATPSVVRVAVSDGDASESDPGAWRVVRSGGVAGTLVVDLVGGGTATSGADYAALPASVTFGPGVETVTVALTGLADALVEGDERVSLAAVAGDGCAVSGSPATIVLRDDDTTFRVLAPNGGGTLIAGQAFDVVWTSTLPTTQAVEVLFSADGGATWTVLQATTNDGITTVRNPHRVGANNLIRVAATTGLPADRDDSDLAFASVPSSSTKPLGCGLGTGIAVLLLGIGAMLLPARRIRR
jgi:hypothetical protein